MFINKKIHSAILPQSIWMEFVMFSSLQPPLPIISPLIIIHQHTIPRFRIITRWAHLGWVWAWAWVWTIIITTTIITTTGRAITILLPPLRSTIMGAVMEMEMATAIQMPTTMAVETVTVETMETMETVETVQTTAIRAVATLMSIQTITIMEIISIKTQQTLAHIKIGRLTTVIRMA